MRRHHMIAVENSKTWVEQRKNVSESNRVNICVLVYAILRIKIISWMKLWTIYHLRMFRAAHYSRTERYVETYSEIQILITILLLDYSLLLEASKI
jgi:hypothetical protein